MAAATGGAVAASAAAIAAQHTSSYRVKFKLKRVSGIGENSQTQDNLSDRQNEPFRL
jgi:hypothetical protein